MNLKLLIIRFVYKCLRNCPPLYNIGKSTLSWTRKTLGPISLKKAASNTPCKIIIGASGTSYKGWTPTDIEYLNVLRAEDWEKFFKKNFVDALLAEHVWEHLSFEEGFMAAKTCFKYLKPGGHIRIAVPDGYHPDKDYIENVRPNGSGNEASEHKVLFNYITLKNMFENCGYIVHLLEYFDEKGNHNLKNWSTQDGMILRSRKNNKNRSDLWNTSIILDAVKPLGLTNMQ